MTVQEFNKKYLLSFQVNEMHPENLEFYISAIDRNTLQPSLDIKRERIDTPVNWFINQIEIEIEEERSPEKFRVQFYENNKRKLINKLFIKNNIKGLDPLQPTSEISFLFS